MTKQTFEKIEAGLEDALEMARVAAGPRGTACGRGQSLHESQEMPPCLEYCGDEKCVCSVKGKPARWLENGVLVYRTYGDYVDD